MHYEAKFNLSCVDWDGEKVKVERTMKVNGYVNYNEAFLWLVRAIKRSEDLSDDHKLILLEDLPHDYLHAGRLQVEKGDKWTYEFDREDEFGDMVNLEVSVTPTEGN